MRYVEAMFRKQYFRGLPMSLGAAKQRRIKVVFGISVDGLETEVKKDIFSKYMFFDLGMGKYLSSNSYYNPSFFFGGNQIKSEVVAESDLSEEEREEFFDNRREESEFERVSLYKNGYVNILKDKFLSLRHDLLLKEIKFKLLTGRKLKKRYVEMQNVFQFEFDLLSVEEQDKFEYFNLDVLGLKKFLKMELNCFFEFNLWTVYKKSLVDYNFFNLTCNKVTKGFAYVRNVKKVGLKSKLGFGPKLKIKVCKSKKLKIKKKKKKRKIRIIFYKYIFRFKVIRQNENKRIKFDFFGLGKFEDVFCWKKRFVYYFLLNVLFKKELSKKLVVSLFLKLLFEKINLYVFFKIVKFLKVNGVSEYNGFFSYLFKLLKINLNPFRFILWNYLNYYSLGVLNMLLSYFMLVNLGIVLARVCYGKLNLLFDVFCFLGKFERLVLKFGNVDLVQWLNKYNIFIRIKKVDSLNILKGLVSTNLTYRIGSENKINLSNAGYMFFSKKKGFFLMLFGFRYFVKRTKLVSIICFGKRFLRVFCKIKFLIFFLFEFSSLAARRAERKFAHDKREELKKIELQKIELKLKGIDEVKKKEEKEKKLEMMAFENRIKQRETLIATYRSKEGKLKKFEKSKEDLEKLKKLRELKVEDPSESEVENMKRRKNLQRKKKFDSAKKNYNYDFFFELNEFDYKKKKDNDEFVDIFKSEKLSYSVCSKIRKILQILIIKLCFIFYSYFDIIGYFTKGIYKFVRLLLLLFKKFFNNILFYIEIAVVCRKSLFNRLVKYWILYKHKINIKEFSVYLGFIMHVFRHVIKKSKLNKILGDFEYKNFLVFCSLLCEIFKLYSSEFIEFSRFKFFYLYKVYAGRHRSNYFWKLFLMNYDLRFDLPSENYLFGVRNYKNILSFLFKKGKRLKKKRLKWLFLK